MTPNLPRIGVSGNPGAIHFVIEGQLVVELKAVDAMKPVFVAQTLTYLRAGGYGRGLLINFNEVKLVNGIRRFVL